MKQYKLFIDETGHPHKNHHSTHFALVGIVIENGHQQELQVKADQLRFKYWNKTNVVFHSEDIGRRAGEYSMFSKDEALAKQFEKQLLNFLYSCPIHVTAAIVDKASAYSVGWKEETIITNASESLVMDLLAFLYGQGSAQGRIVYETSGSIRDSLYLKAFHRYLDPGWEQKHADYSKVREHITSITFASKLNHDTEMQLADLFSYAAICKHLQMKGIKTFPPDSYEQKLITVLDKKLLATPPNVANRLKKKYYSHINGLVIHPPKKPVTKRSQKKKTAWGTRLSYDLLQQYKRSYPCCQQS